MDKIKALWALYRAGSAVADPVAWKRGQITVALLTAVLGACVGLAKTCGYVLPVSDDQLAAIAGGVLAVIGVFNHTATVVSTERIDAVGRTAVQRVGDPGEGDAHASDDPGPAQVLQREAAKSVQTRSVDSNQDFARDSDRG